MTILHHTINMSTGKMLDSHAPYKGKDCHTECKKGAHLPFLPSIGGTFILTMAPTLHYPAQNRTSLKPVYSNETRFNDSI